MKSRAKHEILQKCQSDERENRERDRLRDRGAITRLAERAAAGGDAATAPHSPVEDVARRRLSERVRAALTELSADERRALELAYYEGLSHSEIAAQLATPLGTIKPRVRAPRPARRSSCGRCAASSRSPRAF